MCFYEVTGEIYLGEKCFDVDGEKKKRKGYRGLSSHTIYQRKSNRQRTTYVHTAPQVRTRITNQSKLAKMERIGRREAPKRKKNLAQREYYYSTCSGERGKSQARRLPASDAFSQ